MGRWEPNARERLQHAAMTLFLERDYAEVTVAEIAERAGVTKRTFFNHFTDKREVLFAGAQAFEDGVVRHLAETDDELEAIEAAVTALTRAGADLLSNYVEYARLRRTVIAASPELHERDLIKMSALATAITEGLAARREPGRTAAFAAQTAVIVFTAAYDDWAEDTTADFGALMRRSLESLRKAVHPLSATAAGDQA
ncbi:TetR family transcriptional regulator [Amycolatopsis sp., V23-08]|uniref:TetR family transcriptional regulator n=1 Tax=Amycolatopsis heterodermiae TaxID=3110235 RepID=A0ABU5R6L8_9PSEU|nr:TetR family transcriptional regulator [Amycolatopsis sp., V23-08]MEA5360921.1 TetR family transcriptional regulator [Amycolatopsis sp., V23-08]